MIKLQKFLYGKTKAKKKYSKTSLHRFTNRKLQYLKKRSERELDSGLLKAQED